MEDLLKEDDFIKAAPVYNYKKYFGQFYLFAFLGELFFFIFMMVFPDVMPPLLIGAVMLLYPAITSVLLFLLKKNNRSLPFVKISLGVTLLHALYYFPVILATVFISHSSAFELGSLFGVAFIQYIVSIGMVAVLYYALRNGKP